MVERGRYPDGLENEQIPLAARILRVADTYAAQTSSRPFRAALTAEAAKQYLIEWAGIEFDPAEPGYAVFDEGSAQGVAIERDGRMLTVAGARGVALKDGDLIFFGKARARFELTPNQLSEFN